MVTAALVAMGGRRMSLDELVPLMTDPGFVSRFSRVPPAQETCAHVSPSILETESPKSRYVRRWRRHARHCAACASVFRFYGLRVR